MGDTMQKEIMQLDKEQIFKLLLKIIIDTNVWAFRLEEELSKYDKTKAKKLSLELHHEFGLRQARGLKKMGLITNTGLEAVEQALSYSHWAVLEDLRIERLNGNTLRFGTVDCSNKRAMDKAGKKLDCKDTGLAIRQSFLEVIEPRAMVKPIVEPADKDKQGANFTCLWEVTLS